MADLAPHMAAVALKLLGEPNAKLSTPGVLRFGRRGSLAVDLEKGTYFDHAAGYGGGVLTLIGRELRLTNGACIDWLRAELGIDVGAPRQARSQRRPVALYDYQDAVGDLVLQVVRYAEPKDFRQRKPDGRGGWVWSTKGVAPVPYRLAAMLKAQEIFICEGERDCDRLDTLGIVATCNPGGAGKWPEAFAEHFQGRHVVIIPDNDQAGRDHGQDVARKLAGVVASIKVIELPGLPEKGDVSDWLDKGGSTERLLELAEDAPEWEAREHAPPPGANGHASDPDDAEAVTAVQPWPEPLGEDAYHGIAGEIVMAILPETEADPAGLLFQSLAGIGCALGPHTYVKVEATKHPPLLFTVQVGKTAKARKGTGWARVLEPLKLADPEWAEKRVVSGLSSGEGLIFNVRDPSEEQPNDKKNGKGTDAGVTDKRLMVFEGEFAKVLRNMERPGNILSTVLRDTWDHGNLRTLIKTDANQATGAHVGLVGHITDDELRRYLDHTDMANGLANRMLFTCVQRSKLLPRGGKPVDWSSIVPRLQRALVRAPRGEILRTEAFWRLWEEKYPELSDDRPGMMGAITGRAEAQVLRLSLIYALLDGQEFIDEVHLKAALACWKYAEDSARFVFGDSMGDPVADETLRALRAQQDGMTRNELMNHFGRNQNSGRISTALAMLAKGNFVRCEIESTGGRPAERWWATR